MTAVLCASCYKSLALELCGNSHINSSMVEIKQVKQMYQKGLKHYLCELFKCIPPPLVTECYYSPNII